MAREMESDLESINTGWTPIFLMKEEPILILQNLYLLLII